LDSYKPRLKEVVANDFHVHNEQFTNVFERIFREIKKDGGLIKILSNGGEGKSTFLLSIAKQLSTTYPVFYCQKLSVDVPNQIRETLSYLNSSLIPILLLDDAAASETELDQIGEELANFKGGLVVILAERYFRYNNIASIKKFENSFCIDSEVIRYNLTKSLANVFNKLFDALTSHSDSFTPEDREKYQKLFLTESKITTAERIFNVLKLAREEKKIKFDFDWNEWLKVYPDPPLKYLYLFVSTFYQFGNMISLEFLRSFSEFKNLSKIEIRKAIDESVNQPIIRSSELLLLRHEKIAEWYIKTENEFENVNDIIERWLSNINTVFSMKLLIWTYRNRDFKKSKFSHLLPLNKVKQLLVEYLKNNPNDLSSRTELSKIYQQQKKWTEAESILKEYIQLDPSGLHPRTELSKIYQKQKKWKEAENILLELLNIDKDNLQARTELSKIYQQQKKWKDAENILLELVV